MELLAYHVPSSGQPHTRTVYSTTYTCVPDTEHVKRRNVGPGYTNAKATKARGRLGMTAIGRISLALNFETGEHPPANEGAWTIVGTLHYSPAWARWYGRRAVGLC